MAKGIIGQLQLFGTVILAVPVAYWGLSTFLGGDRLVGGAVLALAVLMVAIEEYVTKPTDVAADAAQEAAGKVVETPDDEE